MYILFPTLSCPYPRNIIPNLIARTGRKRKALRNIPTSYNFTCELGITLDVQTCEQYVFFLERSSVSYADPLFFFFFVFFLVQRCLILRLLLYFYHLCLSCLRWTHFYRVLLGRKVFVKFAREDLARRKIYNLYSIIIAIRVKFTSYNSKLLKYNVWQNALFTASLFLFSSLLLSCCFHCLSHFTQFSIISHFVYVRPMPYL